MESLQTIAYISIAVAILCMIIIIIDILAGHKQHINIMNVVCPITALYSGVLGLAAYYTIGRKDVIKHSAMNARQQPSHHKMNRPQKLIWMTIAIFLIFHRRLEALQPLFG